MTTPAPIPVPQAHPRRIAAILSAAACIAAGILLLVAAGLPDRARETAQFVLPDARVVAAEIGAVAPPFRLMDPDGANIALDSFKGQAVIVNFWATWCAPCRVEMPELQKIAERYAGQVTVLGINTGEDAGAVRAWRDEFALTFPLLLDVEGTAARDYRLRGQPTTVIVAPDGVISAIVYGPADSATLEQAIVALLEN